MRGIRGQLAVAPFFTRTIVRLVSFSNYNLKKNPEALKLNTYLDYDYTELVMKIRPILLSKSTVFSRSKICIFSRSDPRFGVTI